MPSLVEADLAAKKFAELEFYNSKFMSVGIDKNLELVVTLQKKIRTDNLPTTFEGFRVTYRYLPPARM